MTRDEQLLEVFRREQELHDKFGPVDTEIKLGLKIAALFAIHKDIYGDAIDMSLDSLLTKVEEMRGTGLWKS